MATASTEATRASAGSDRRKLVRNRWAILAVPGIVFLVGLFGLPLLEIVRRSVTPSFANYEIFIDSPVYVRVLGTTFRTALIVTVTCLALGYPYAYVMYTAGPRVAVILGLLVLVSFWSSLLVRTYAWTVLLQDTGVINWFLLRLGILDEPLTLMRNTLGVTIGMTHILLPFMILPIYAVMRRIDLEYVTAAASLGARPLTAFRRVFFPLSLPGVYAGCLLVFILSLGYYITPALLGSTRNAMLGELIVNQVSQQLQFGVGAALGVVLLVLTLLTLGLGSRLVRFADFTAPEED